MSLNSREVRAYAADSSDIFAFVPTRDGTLLPANPKLLQERKRFAEFSFPQITTAPSPHPKTLVACSEKTINQELGIEAKSTGGALIEAAASITMCSKFEYSVRLKLAPKGITGNTPNSVFSHAISSIKSRSIFHVS
jgi:hypothetical protein